MVNITDAILACDWSIVLLQYWRVIGHLFLPTTRVKTDGLRDLNTSPEAALSPAPASCALLPALSEATRLRF